LLEATSDSDVRSSAAAGGAARRGRRFFAGAVVVARGVGVSGGAGRARRGVRDASPGAADAVRARVRAFAGAAAAVRPAVDRERVRPSTAALLLATLPLLPLFFALFFVLFFAAGLPVVWASDFARRAGTAFATGRAGAFALPPLDVVDDVVLVRRAIQEV
jgi:hypothetical protein